MFNPKIREAIEKGDDLLFARVADGDKEAFDAFFDCYYSKLVQYAEVFLRCKQEAEDVVAEVLTNTLIHRERVFRLPHVEAYLYSSVKNKAFSSLKKRGRTIFSPAESQPLRTTSTTSDNPYELLVAQELHILVRKIIQELPPKRQMVFRLLREEGLSYRQVAELMEISERTVEVHLKLAIKTLRENIEKYLGQRESKKAASNLVNILLPLSAYIFFGS